MNLTPRTALGHTLGALRGLRVRRTAVLGTVPVATVLLIGPGAGTAGAEPAGKGTAAGAIPWYVPPAVTLLAAAVTASATWLTARSNRAHQRRDRRDDRLERREREAELRAEEERRERRAAARTVWAPYLHRIEEMLLAVGSVQQEAQRRSLHDNDAAASELQRLQRTAEQYADHAPGGLPQALRKLAEALAGIDRHLLPDAAELDRISLHSSPSTACLPLFTRAGEQARATDRLAQALKDTYRALHQEWGMD